MLKRFNMIHLFIGISVILFLVYEKYLGKVVLYFNLPFIPNMRTVTNAILKYIPLIIILFFVFQLFVYFSKKKSKQG